MLVSRMQIRKWRVVYGVLVVAFAWLLSNTQYLPFTYSILYPEYYAALAGQNSLYNSISIREGDKGFKEIAKLIETKYQVQNINYIAPDQVKFKLYPKGVKTVEIVLNVNYQGAEKVSVQLDLKNDLKNIYMGRDYFIYSLIIFAIGVIILLYPAFRVRKADRV